jgi:hypothetical protein
MLGRHDVGGCGINRCDKLEEQLGFVETDK